MKTNTLLLAICLIGYSCYEDPSGLAKRFKVESSSESAPADGKTTITLEVSLVNVTNKANHEITLSTSIGTFSNGSSTQKLNTSSSGKITTTIKSAESGTAVVAIAMKELITIQKELVFESYALEPGKDELSIVLNDTVQPADGFSTIVATVGLNSTKSAAFRDVTITSSVGTFENGQPSITIKTDQSGFVKARLKSGNISSGTLTVTMDKVLVKNTQIRFMEAGPDITQIVLPGTTFKSGSSNPITFNITYRRYKGNLNLIPPTTVFVVFSYGTYPNLTYQNLTAQAINATEYKVTTSIPDTNYTGPAYISVNVSLVSSLGYTYDGPTTGATIYVDAGM